MAKSLDYLAGLFDGEGSFSIQVGLRRNSPWFVPSMSVNLYYGSEVLQHFVSTLGGVIYPYQRDGALRGARWHLGARVPVMDATRSLLPHLEIKRDIAERFLAALAMFPASTKGVALKLGRRSWSTEQAIAVAEIALTLNPPRSRKTNKTLDYLTIMRSSL
jgi:hypothetical protein